MQVPTGYDLKSDDKLLAKMLLNSRKAVQGTVAPADIPEVVEIKALSSQFDGVKLPHRKIVNKLVAGIEKSNLAAYFHREPGTICQGCHHNSPASAKPPKCASCHGKPFDERDAFKPGLMAAYHIQCMDCHQAMKIQQPVSTNCTACHRAKQ